MTSEVVELYEDEELAPSGVAVNEVWRPTTLEDADWALYRLAVLERQAKDNAELVRQAIERVKARGAQLNEGLEAGARFFRGRLEAFLAAEGTRTLLLGGGKKRSRALPHGTLGYRASPGGLEVTDPSALMAWAMKQPGDAGFIRTKVEVAMAVVQAHFRDTGEVPPGCEVKPEADALVVKPELLEGEVLAVTAAPPALPKGE